MLSGAVVSLSLESGWIPSVELTRRRSLMVVGHTEPVFALELVVEARHLTGCIVDFLEQFLFVRNHT